jgi:hypothetical protein
MRGRLGLLGVAVAIAALAFATAAHAGQIFGERFHEEDEFPEASFCGVEGLDVTWHVTRDGHAHAVSRGRDKLPYFGFTFKGTEVVTNDDNGNFVTSLTTIADKDQRVTDNGDGTLTVLVLSTGNATLYDEDGNVLARNPGQVRFEILIDNAGTPTDPSDDEFIEFVRLVKDSTGRTDDFCEAAVPELLGS